MDTEQSLMAELMRARASPREHAAARYFRGCGYELTRMSERSWSLQAVPSNGAEMASDFRPEWMSGNYKSLKEIWFRWRWRFIQHILTEELERWVKQMLEHGRPEDRVIVKAWNTHGRGVRLPRHLQEDLDSAIMGPVEVPRNWRSKAAEAATGQLGGILR